MKKYFLVGIPGAGKSTLGAKVANELKMSFFDTDIMTLEGLNLDHAFDFFRFSSASRFYEGQYEVIKQFEMKKEPAIIATGAEVALMPQCVNIMKKIGKIIYIDRCAEVIVEELGKSKKAGFVLVNEAGEPKGAEPMMEQRSVRLYQEEVLRYKEVADLVFENRGNEEEGVRGLTQLIIQEMGEHDKEVREDT